MPHIRMVDALGPVKRGAVDPSDLMLAFRLTCFLYTCLSPAAWILHYETLLGA
jgi:hypothetical protein